MKSIGDEFELRAARWLAQRGLRLQQRNFSSAVGEIDIIAWDGPQLVFIEVRARSHPAFAGAAASVSRGKQARIVRTAALYLQQHKLTDVPCRFDVVAFEPRQSGAEINWIRGAFTA